jgi:hypothetical protein
MDLMDIARRSGLEPRRLRYAIYHTLVPRVSRVEVGRGSVRRFTEFEAFGVALAATLLEAGLRRDLTAECMEALARRLGRTTTAVNDVPLYLALASRGTARLDVADRRYVRLRVGPTAGRKPSDTGWQPTAPAGATAPTGYEPLVLLSINITPLRDAIRGERPS